MIRSFRHRGLAALYERGDGRRIRPDQVARTRRILALLDVARTTADIDAPGLRLHPLKGNLKGFWAVSISGNWRIVFRLDGGDAFDVDLVDYH